MMGCWENWCFFCLFFELLKMRFVSDKHEDKYEVTKGVLTSLRTVATQVAALSRPHNSTPCVMTQN